MAGELQMGINIEESAYKKPWMLSDPPQTAISVDQATDDRSKQMDVWPPRPSLTPLLPPHLFHREGEATEMFLTPLHERGPLGRNSARER
jgi:hypothetical protein